MMKTKKKIMMTINQMNTNYRPKENAKWVKVQISLEEPTIPEVEVREEVIDKTFKILNELNLGKLRKNIKKEVKLKTD